MYYYADILALEPVINGHFICGVAINLFVFFFCFCVSMCLYKVL